MLNLVFMFLGLCATGYHIFIGSAWWICVLNFFIVTLGLDILFIGGVAIWSLFLPKEYPDRPKKYAYRVIHLVLNWIMPILLVKIKIEGEEKVPDQPCVYVANHLSSYDPMVVLAKKRKRRILYISKPENFKIPLCGPFIRQAGCLAIPKDNPMEAMRTLKKAAELLKSEQVDIGIYPEGRRGPAGTIGGFKEGSFLLAKKAEAPIVVCSLRGLEKVKRNWCRRPTSVSVKIIDVIPLEVVKAKKMSELALMCHDMVKADLNAVDAPADWDPHNPNNPEW